jgi:hypothetical protein
MSCKHDAVFKLLVLFFTDLEHALGLREAAVGGFEVCFQRGVFLFEERCGWWVRVRVGGGDEVEGFGEVVAFLGGC